MWLQGPQINLKLDYSAEMPLKRLLCKKSEKLGSQLKSEEMIYATGDWQIYVNLASVRSAQFQEQNWHQKHAGQVFKPQVGKYKSIKILTDIASHKYHWFKSC